MNFPMRKSVFTALSISMLSFVSVSDAEDESKCPDLPDAVDTVIAEHAESERAAEPCDYRQVVRGDLDGKPGDEIAVEYTLEGACGAKSEEMAGTCGNNYSHFLRVFTEDSDTWSSTAPLKVGGEGIRNITLNGVSNRIIDALSFNYADKDPMCCPSVEGTTQFEVRNGMVTERKKS